MQQAIKILSAHIGSELYLRSDPAGAACEVPNVSFMSSGVPEFSTIMPFYSDPGPLRQYLALLR